MANSQKTAIPCVTRGTLFRCECPQELLGVKDVFPIEEAGVEILHVAVGPKSYEVLAKMGGLLYSAGDEVQFVLEKNGRVMLRNAENEPDFILFDIPDWLFHRDFVPCEQETI